MQKINRLLQQPGFLAFTFALFVLLLIWPILAIPSHQELIGFFKYLFTVWALMILALYLLAKNIGGEGESGDDSDTDGGRPHV